MCLEEEETFDHFLIHCHWASFLWHLSLSLKGASSVQPCSVKDVVMAWRRRMKDNGFLVFGI